MKKLRAVLSSLLILCVCLLAASGAVLFFMKTGIIGPFSRKFILDSHALISAVMVVVAIFHLYINRKMYKAEMKALLGKRDEK
jgi:cytochrome b subunit of formate dehydrogenase